MHGASAVACTAPLGLLTLAADAAPRGPYAAPHAALRAPYAAPDAAPCVSYAAPDAAPCVSYAAPGVSPCRSPGPRHPTSALRALRGPVRPLVRQRKGPFAARSLPA